MALAHAILTALSHEPLSGYDLAKAFRTSTGFFWRASRQQIYSELRILEAKGLLVGARQEQERYPDKMLWSITPSGATALKEWLDSPSQPASIKEELLVKLYALENADLSAFQAQLVERRHYHAERLELFRTIERKLTSRPVIDVRDLGRLLGVRSGIGYERAMHDWCGDAIKQVASLPTTDEHARKISGIK